MIRPLDADFAATAEIETASSLLDRPPVILTGVTVGVAYEPLRRLRPLLGERVRLPAVAEDACDFDDDWSLEVAHPGEVPAAVETLAALVLDHALAFAHRHASLDALLAAHGADDPREMDLMAPALLAAGHRFAEAQQALAAYPYELSRDDRRLVRQLRRFIDSGGDESLIPEEPPPPPEPPPGPSVTELWREVKAEREAVESVRGAGPQRSRGEQKAMLEAELASRAVARSPLWVERTLDHLWDTPAGRRTQTVESLKAVGRLGLGLVRALRGDVPDLSPPGWLEPPARAAYVYGALEALATERGGAWTAVSLDPQATDWLARVYSAMPRLSETASLDAWLDRAPGRPRELAVHLGERPVGTIEDERGEALLDIAATRDEVPCVRAQLTPRPTPPGYLLQVALPPAREN